MTYGKPIFHARETPPAALNVLGPESAMAKVLAEYLRCAVFRVWGGDAPDRDFALKDVLDQWPDAGHPLPYPCASIVEATETFHEDQLRPIPLEETLGTYDCLVGYAPDPAWPKTVLWKTAEAAAEFQLDFWCSNNPDREAIEARLGYLFSPGQERTGVLLGGHPKYYDRVVRATLLAHQKMDLADSVYANERRLRAVVRCEIEVVDLRIATLLTPTLSAEVTDPVDPGETP